MNTISIILTQKLGLAQTLQLRHSYSGTADTVLVECSVVCPFCPLLECLSSWVCNTVVNLRLAIGFGIRKDDPRKLMNLMILIQEKTATADKQFIDQ